MTRFGVAPIVHAPKISLVEANQSPHPFVNSRARSLWRVVLLRVAMTLLISCASFAATPEDEKSAQQLGIKIEVVQQIRRSEGLTNQALQRLPADKLSRLLWRLNHPDLPRERAEFYLLQEADENGTVPAGTLRLAAQQLRQARKTLSKSTVAGLPTGTQVDPAFLSFGGGLEQGRWRSLGPDKVGGRTRSIVFDPANPDHFWVGSVSGGIWQTSDGGQHFSPVDDLMANLAVTSMVMDPTNPKTLYAATGEGVDGVSRGAGIFVTTDRVHWKQLPATATADFQYVNRLAISADGEVLFAACSQPEGMSSGGIFRSDDPLHQKWTRTNEGEFVDVKCHPTDGQKLIAATTDGRVVYSDKQGVGGSWKEVKHGNPWTSRVEVAYCRKNPAIVYASVDTNGGEIWRSEDNGQTFERRASELANDNAGPRELAYYLDGQGDYANCIWAGDPTNEDFFGRRTQPLSQHRWRQHLGGHQ